MASKVLVPAAPFAKLQVKKSPPEATTSGFFVGGDATARVAHLEHSVRFLQEQHRLMLSGLHAEIEALRERNRDLQFQLLFNKDSAPKVSTPPDEEATDPNEEVQSLRAEVCRLEREAATARVEARAAEARAQQLQRLLDAQTEKLRSVESNCGEQAGEEGEGGAESRGSLRARLADAERLVRRLRGDAERQRRELQCMKNSLHASLRASGLDSFGFQNTYHFPPVQDFWTDPIRDAEPRGARRRPLALPELVPHRATIFANTHARGRNYGYEKSKKPPVTNGDAAAVKTPDEQQDETRLKKLNTDSLLNKKDKLRANPLATYPELKIVVTKMIPHGKVNAAGASGEARPRPRRHHHRKHTTDHT
ncbi:uncharacterized protein [Battus philenor]|uniref:uncharacterized protein isoform X2 n=1 Tax=Battus philenor TaxID=42288 RepID=UPI0035D126D4